MKKILLIRCSMNNQTPIGSVSNEGLRVFKQKYIEEYPEDQIIEKDLNEIDFLQTSMNDKNLKDWFDENSKELINELKSIDKLIIATSMINFNYPSLLKNYIDKIMLAGETFKYKYSNGKGSSEGLVKNLKVSFIITQGSPVSWYPFSALPNNLIGAFEFIGASVEKPVMIDGTKTPELIELSKEDIISKFKNELYDLVKNMN